MVLTMAMWDPWHPDETWDLLCHKWNANNGTSFSFQWNFRIRFSVFKFSVNWNVRDRMYAHTDLENFWITENFRELMVFWSGLHTSTSSSRERVFFCEWMFVFNGKLRYGNFRSWCKKIINKRAIQNKRCRPRLTNFHTWKARVIHWVQVTSMSGETVVASIYMVN